MTPKNQLYAFVFCLINLSAFSAAKIQSRIVGGDEVKPFEIRYQVSLTYDGSHFCGGTIIGPKHILSAAHCFYGFAFEEPYDELKVVTGSILLSDHKNEHSIKNFTIHKNFTNDQMNSYPGDIAVITLRDAILFDDAQAPAKLPTAPATNGSLAITSGWGTNGVLSPYASKFLKKAKLQVLNAEGCQPRMKFKIHESQICGLSEDGSGTCKGDSGGPLVVNGTVYGVTSWTMECRPEIPNVFTNVYHYLDFIRDVIESDY